jgi:hypothetical protein
VVRGSRQAFRQGASAAGLQHSRQAVRLQPDLWDVINDGTAAADDTKIYAEFLVPLFWQMECKIAEVMRTSGACGWAQRSAVVHLLNEVEGSQADGLPSTALAPRQRHVPGRFTTPSSGDPFVASCSHSMSRSLHYTLRSTIPSPQAACSALVRCTPPSKLLSLRKFR